MIALIPARSGSKGVPKKNIKLLAGYPLMAYSIKAAYLTKGIDRIIVSTDSEQYAEIAFKYGAEIPFIRPSELSEDGSTDFDVVDHCLNWLEKKEKQDVDCLAYLRPTTPVRDPDILEKAIDAFQKNTQSTALRSVHEMSETAYKVLEIKQGYLCCICSGSLDIDSANLPRQTYKKTYEGNGYIDIFRKECVKNGNVLGNKVVPFFTQHCAELDTPDDFEYLEYLITKNQSHIIQKLFKP